MAPLDKGGLALSLLIGVLIFLFSGFPPLLLLISFLFLSVIATDFGKNAKKKMGVYERTRGWKNVLSNGTVPLLTALLPALGISTYLPFIGSVAAITADKFNSEIGVLSKEPPTSLENGKRVKPGTSGAVSLLGFIGGFAGAGTIALLAYMLFKINGISALALSFAGVVGALFDSFLGIGEEKGWGNKEVSNLGGSAVGALIGMLIEGML